MSFLDFFRRKKVEDEAARRTRLLRTGRITDGVILDITSNTAGVAEIFFTYTVHGVNYRATQTLTDEHRQRLQTYIPAAHITVRYDPYRPGNSVVV